MYGVDPYLAERSMDQSVHEIQREAKIDGLARQATAQRLGWVSQRGHMLLRQAGHALSNLGSWLEQHGVQPELPLDSRAGRGG